MEAQKSHVLAITLRCCERRLALDRPKDAKDSVPGQLISGKAHACRQAETGGSCAAVGWGVGSPPSFPVVPFTPRCTAPSAWLHSLPLHVFHFFGCLGISADMPG